MLTYTGKYIFDTITETGETYFSVGFSETGELGDIIITTLYLTNNVVATNSFPVDINFSLPHSLPEPYSANCSISAQHIENSTFSTQISFWADWHILSITNQIIEGYRKYFTTIIACNSSANFITPFNIIYPYTINLTTQNCLTNNEIISVVSDIGVYGYRHIASTVSSLFNINVATNMQHGTHAIRYISVSNELGNSGLAKQIATQITLSAENSKLLTLINELGNSGLAKQIATQITLSAENTKLLTLINELGNSGLAKQLATKVSIQYENSNKHIVSPTILLSDIAQQKTIATKLAIDTGFDTWQTVTPVTIVNSDDNTVFANKCAIFADNVNISNMVIACTTSASIANIFAEVEVEIRASAVKKFSKPELITIYYPDNVIEKYHCEECTENSNNTLKLWGRSYSEGIAIDDNTYTWNDRNVLSALFSEAATDIMGGTVQWNTGDWTMPNLWEIAATKYEAVAQIARTANARFAISAKDGAVVLPKWIKRPPDLAKDNSVININRDNSISIDIVKNDATKYNKVKVNGYAISSLLPEFELEGEAILGQPATLRLYWTGEDIPDFNTYLTSGEAFLIEKMVTETITETITFQDGTATVKRPIWLLEHFHWIGNDYGQVTWLENGYSKELLCDVKWGVAEVTYVTSYDKWQLTGQAVTTVIFGIDNIQQNISATVQSTAEGEDLSDVSYPLASNIPNCVQIGIGLLDDSRPEYSANITKPYIQYIALGSIIRVENEKAILKKYGRVTAVKNSISKTMITTIEADLC